MTFKLKTFAAVGALIGSLALVGCGQDEKDPNHIKVGVIVGAEQQVAEVAQKVAKDKYGLDVELVTFNDYVFFKQKTAYGIVSREWSSDVCSSDLRERGIFTMGKEAKTNAMRDRKSVV